MNVNMVYPPRPARRGRVIALHCSGGGASQWSYLAEALGGRYEVLAPEHYGCESTGPWTGEHAFTLADEAARAIALIDRSDEQGAPRRAFLRRRGRAQRRAGPAGPHRQHGAV